MIKWVSFAFGVHEKNSKKFEKDIQMERFKNGTVVLRGRGHRGVCIEFSFIFKILSLYELVL